jgi:glycosyltransferase involved in cell wall biosynthesis
MRRNEWVACVGPFRFPWGEPNSRRVYGLVGSLAAAGHHVVVASGDPGPTTVTKLAEIGGPGSVSYLGLGEKAPADAGLLASSVQMFVRWGWRTLRWLEAQPTRPSHVLVHDGQAPYMVHLQRWCRRHDIPLIIDVVDWWNGRYVRGGVLGPLNVSTKLALRYFYPRCDGIITISSLLENHYRGTGKPVLRIPPTLDVRAVPVGGRPATTGTAHLSLVYAGNPCRNKKDQLSAVIEAVGRADRAGSGIELRVFGPSPEDIRRLLGGRKPPPNVRTMGRLPQQDVPRALQEADFSILVRRPERATNAGFSTKFCESLASGTPVIANLTSDMGNYLRHGREGLVCRDHSPDGLAEAFQDALRLSVTQRLRMRQAARERALESFDFRAYARPVGDFFAGLRR